MAREHFHEILYCVIFTLNAVSEKNIIIFFSQVCLSIESEDVVLQCGLLGIINQNGITSLSSPILHFYLRTEFTHSHLACNGVSWPKLFFHECDYTNLVKLL